MPIPSRPSRPSPLSRRLAAAAAALAVVVAVLGGAGSAWAAGLTPQQVPASPDGVANVVEIGSALYLSAYGTSTTIHRLYRFDGTTFTEVPGSPDDVGEIVEDGSLVALTAVDPITSVPVLWTYDPASGVFAELPGSPQNPQHVTAFPVSGFNIELVFGADAAVGRHLYSWDGAAFSDLTPTGTPNSPSDEVVNQNTLYFIGVNGGVLHLYFYNGVGAPVGATTDPGQVSDLSQADDILYFQADDDGDNSTPNVLMTLDGSTGIISPVLFAGSALQGGTQVVSFGGVDYVGSDTVAGLPLYRFAGSGAPLEPVIGISDAGLTSVAGLGSTLYLHTGAVETLSAVNGVTGTAVAGSPADARNFQVLGGTLFFQATDDLAVADRLWQLVPASDPAAPSLAATGLDSRSTVVAAGAALLSLLAGLALVGAGIVRNRRIASR